MPNTPCEPLFEPFQIGSLTLRNRVVMAPMTRRKSPTEQTPTEQTAAYYGRRAAGGVGLIITEGTRFDPKHRADTDDIPAIMTDGQINAWARVVQRVHDESDGAGRIALQLWHTGRHGLDPLGPSAVPAPRRDTPGGFKPVPRAMSIQDMQDVAGFMADGAVNAKRAGFHAVEIHGAHTYLLDTFLSPQANVRTDSYGGSFENRMRFPIECVRAVRAAVGAQFPIIYRFSRWSFDPTEPVHFSTPGELSMWVRALRDAGVNLLHVSTPDATAPAFPEVSSDEARSILMEAGFSGSMLPVTLAGWARAISGLPTIAVGRISVSASMSDDAPVSVTDPSPAAELLRTGEADLIAVGRALLANPGWCRMVRDGRWKELKPYSRALLSELW